MNIELTVAARAAPVQQRAEEGQNLKSNRGENDFSTSLNQRVQSAKVGKEKNAQSENQQEEVNLVQIPSILVPIPVVLDLQIQESGNGESVPLEENASQNIASQVENKSLLLSQEIEAPIDESTNGVVTSTTMPVVVEDTITENVVPSLMNFSTMIVEEKNPGLTSNVSEEIGNTLTDDTSEVKLPVHVQQGVPAEPEEIEQQAYQMTLDGDTLTFQAQIKSFPVNHDLQFSRPEAVIRQTSEGIQEMLTLGKASLNLKLHPENLGQINVRIVNSSDGIQVFFTAERTNTAALLEHHLNQLQELLVSAGINIGNLSVGNQPQNREQDFSWLKAPSHARANVESEKVSRLLASDHEVSSLSALDFRA